MSLNMRMAMWAVLALAVWHSVRPLAAVEKTEAAEEYAQLVEAYEAEGGARLFARRFLELAEKHPQDPAAMDALLWVVQRVRGRADTERALKLLEARHLESARLGEAAAIIARSRALHAERLLRAMLEKSPHTGVRARACLHLAELLDGEAAIVEQLEASPELAPRVLQYYGKPYGEHLASLDLKALAGRREQVYETMRTRFADVQVQDQSLGERARRRLFALRHLSVGRTAPEIAGHDVHGRPMRLSDHRGKIVMLTFWGHW